MGALMLFVSLSSAGLPGLSGFVGEFLTLVGTFAVNPWAAAIATFVMILGAAYLLWMFQRIAFGEPSAFLLGIRDHLSDISAVEVLTLVPTSYREAALALGIARWRMIVQIVMRTASGPRRIVSGELLGRAA